eukprot:340545_1
MSQVNQRVTEQSLQSLLPNGLCKSRKLTETESNKINGKVIKSKQQYISFICCNKSVLIKKPLIFRKNAWRMIEVQVSEKYRHLKFIHDLQQGTAENETSMETCASEVGGIYTPNRRAFLNETLKKKFINKRTLSRNLKIRRKLVRKVIKYHRKHYKGTGLLKHKRKTNVKYSTSLDRLEHLQDDRMGVIDDNDLCPSEKNFECEYD